MLAIKNRSNDGRMQKAAIESAKLQAISMIISRMGSKLAQDIEFLTCSLEPDHPFDCSAPFPS